MTLDDTAFTQLPYHVQSAARLFLWLTLLCAVFIPLERWFGQHGDRPGARAWGQDLAYYFVSSMLPAIALAAPLALLATLAHSLLPPAVPAAVAALPLAVQLGLGFVLSEIGFYWGHRLSHTLPFLWRFHAIHHSPEHLYFLINTRAHPVDMVLTRLCAIVPLYLLGLAGPSVAGSVMPAALLVLGAFWGFFIHSNLRLRFGPLEWLVASPAFHHWHHNRSENLHCNYASTLPLLDRLFGTWHLPSRWPAAYGTDTQVAPTLRGQLTDPLRPLEDAPAGSPPRSG